MNILTRTLVRALLDVELEGRELSGNLAVRLPQTVTLPRVLRQLQ
jgi:hypothetical protein